MGRLTAVGKLRRSHWPARLSADVSAGRDPRAPITVRPTKRTSVRAAADDPDSRSSLAPAQLPDPPHRAANLSRYVATRAGRAGPVYARMDGPRAVAAART